MKYSNAAIGARRVRCRRSQDEKFETYVQRRVLDRLGMTTSSFQPTPEVKKHLADAVMWTYHGREFPAPTFELGTAPAGCMYSTVLDLAKFQSCLFAGGKLGDKQLLKPETLEEMFRPQFAKTEAKARVRPRVLGRRIRGAEADRPRRRDLRLRDRTSRRCPSEKLGVIVVSLARRRRTPSCGRIADDALRLMLAAKAGKPLPKIEMSEPLSAEEARGLAGRYRAGEHWLDLTEASGRLYLERDRGGDHRAAPQAGQGSRRRRHPAWGTKITPRRRQADASARPPTRRRSRPARRRQPPAKWKGLIGEYG